MNRQLDSFETRLLTELREHVKERNAEGPNAETSGRRPLGARHVAIAAVLVAVAGAVLLMPGLGSSPAYSVGEGNAGEIRVEINRPEDADGLEAALEKHGIAADITYLPQLQICEPGRYTVVEREQIGIMSSVSERSISVTLSPGSVRDGETFVLAWSVQPLTAEEVVNANRGSSDGVEIIGGFRSTVEFDIAGGPVAPCKPVDSEWGS